MSLFENLLASNTKTFALHLKELKSNYTPLLDKLLHNAEGSAFHERVLKVSIKNLENGAWTTAMYIQFKELLNEDQKEHI